MEKIFEITEIIDGSKKYWGSIKMQGTFEEACNVFFNGYEVGRKLEEGKV
jgi:hypothetical protein